MVKMSLSKELKFFSRFFEGLKAFPRFNQFYAKYQIFTFQLNFPEVSAKFHKYGVMVCT